MKSKVLSVGFGSKSSPSKVIPHRHDYWQLEIVTQGVIKCSISGEVLSLEIGDMLLVPPGLEHGFWYSEPPVAWISIKFEREEEDLPHWAGVIRSNLITRKLISSFKTAIHESPYLQCEKVFVIGFLETILHYVHYDHFRENDNSSELLVKHIMDKVYKRNGKSITIYELAEELSYSRSHLSKKFKEITGESLKSYIDHIRIQKIEELLRYREHSISEIAADLGFSDVFSFSKFFKKHTGMSPRKYI
ncbi:AraC family transcriptional regulator [Paenibacillus sp. NPDC056579]|uniref:helix-turn-helix transcriptional regulator n=1 Tax=unclassified Paenibacillus TaxID=185978 RepID=UPI001EF99D5E|nr:AraC family transcriptional regulator [Paenibacillus sp. H1-7]ULL16705.1 AraC family transcriptional regulator [Paenibacillus sp. H1-7]